MAQLNLIYRGYDIVHVKDMTFEVWKDGQFQSGSHTNEDAAMAWIDRKRRELILEAGKV